MNNLSIQKNKSLHCGNPFKNKNYMSIDFKKHSCCKDYKYLKLINKTCSNNIDQQRVKLANFGLNLEEVECFIWF